MSDKPSHVPCGVCGILVPTNMVVSLGGKTVCVHCKGGVAREMAGAQPVGALRYAGFWIRFAAVLLDGLIVGLPMFVIMMVLLFAAAASGNGGLNGSNVISIVIQAASQVLYMAYQTFFWGRYGATPGKMICRIKIVRSDGAPIGYLRAFGRYWATILSGCICYIGFIIAAFDDEKRALHDRICDTRVVYR